MPIVDGDFLCYLKQPNCGCTACELRRENAILRATLAELGGVAITVARAVTGGVEA